jgi:hypothetical protein
MLKPILKSNWKRRRALIISPLVEAGILLFNDAIPNFDIITFSFDNSDLNLDLINNLEVTKHYKFESEAWGESFFKLCKLIDPSYEVVMFMNSDLFASISSINYFFEINDFFELDFSQPSLSVNSYISHDHTKHIPGGGVKQVPFIEIMMPCLSSLVVNQVNEIGITTISGWGLDCELFPFIENKLNLKPPAVIHDCQVIHAKPVSSNFIYSDGLNAVQQQLMIKNLLRELKNKTT